MNHFSLEHLFWEEGKNPIWLGSNLHLYRNLARYKFPAQLNATELKSTAAILEKAAESYQYFPTDKLSLLEKELLFEHFLCLENFQNAGQGQAFALSRSGQVLLQINLNNHLQIQLFDTSSDILSAWAELMKIETGIGKTHPFAFSPKFGYLTADPTHCGTALQAYLYLHIPALHHTGQLHEILAKQKDEDTETLGLEGSLDDLIGDFLILKNRYTLGVAEEGVLHALQTLAMKLIAAEKTVRSHLKEKGSPAVKDLVSRAYGLLVHSYQLQAKEALSALSLLKLGLDLGWITGVSPQAINNLFFQCRRAHLADILQEKTLDTPELPHRRAEFIHKALQGITLHET